MVDTSENHLFGHGFDRSACQSCPHLVDGATGGSILDRLANAIDDQKCGLCGCPLKNLAATSAPPESCPRLDAHRGQ